mmetsp:Transcript_9637/g.16043  ORF Transcript_9637/g.16043 Transcript_9637/m.16043 type:complete len:147 (+) Transcript_9637:1-441(+)
MVYEDSTKQALLQMMIFHTKCRSDLSLGDKYGSLQLMSFTNDVVGTPSMYKNVTYAVTITNVGSQSVRVGHVISIADQEAKDLLGGSGGPMLGRHASESIAETMLVDLGHARKISASATVSGYDKSLNTCVSFGEMDIVVPETQLE